MRKIALSLFVLVSLSVASLSCYSNKAYTAPSRVRFRAFISNALHPVTGGHLPALEIMDANLDVLSFSPIALSSSFAFPDVGALSVSNDKQVTLAYSPGSNSFALVSNATEQAVLSTGTLPDSTESFVIGQDDLHAYAAVPNAPVVGGPPGAIIQIDLLNGNISGSIPVPHVRFIALANFGATMLAFSDNSGGVCAPESGAVTLITTAKIGTSADPRSAPLCRFDHPVGAAVEAGDPQVFVLECGPQCGGVQSAVTPLNVANNTVGTRIPVAGATVGFATGLTLYVAGTAPPGSPGADNCSAASPHTLATSCGTLTVIDRSGIAPIRTFTITDGYHSHMELTADGQLFVGSTACTEVNVPASGSNPGEVRGCLSIFNGNKSTVVIPAISGDVTGIAPIPGRTVVYGISGGALTVYDTTTDAPLPNHQTAIIGQLVDVKVIDKAP